MKKYGCFECEHHAKYDLKCDKNTGNYQTENIDECFVLSTYLKALDKANEAADKMIEILDKRCKNTDKKQN